MAKVYVGTYKKYNEGSLNGGWLDLADYQTFGDFLKACRTLHKNERDPEFMIQDTEGFPDGLSCMEWLSEQDFNDVKLAMKEEQQTSEGRPAINIIDYSDKAFAVVGDTKAVKDQLKKMGGRFNGKLSCGAGWIFSNKSREDVERFISSGEVANKVKSENKPTKDGAQFVAWLDEWYALSHDDYNRKNAVGAIKLHDHYYLIDKPSIENRFCFHDEGADYEYYKELMADKETKLARHFKNKNLRDFDCKIERIEKGDTYSKDKRVWWYTGDYDKTKLYLSFNSYGGGNNGETLCTDEEKALILKGLKFGKSMFEKRLDSYLKRYGTSKLHTWTYWADA